MVCIGEMLRKCMFFDCVLCGVVSGVLGMLMMLMVMVVLWW